MKSQLKKSLILSFLLLSTSLLSAQQALESKAESNVIYGMHGGLALLLDVYQPPEPSGYGIIVIPGSGWHQLLSYDATPLNQNPWYLSNIIGQDELLANGYTLFIINHRSAPVFRYPAAVEDAQRAVQFVRHHAERYGINPNKIGALGHSSGGHLANMLGTLDDIANTDEKNSIGKESSKVQAVVSLAAPTDFVKFSSGTEGDLGAVSSFVGTHLPFWRGPDNPVQIEYSLYAEASPINHVDAEDPPFLIVHGTKDNIVPFSQAEVFVKQLEENHVPAEFIKLVNGNHALGIGESRDIQTVMYFGAIVKLFDKYLRNIK